MQQNATQSQQRISEEATKIQLNFQATQAAIQGRPLTSTPVPELRAQTAQQDVIIGPQPLPTDAIVIVQAQSESRL